MLGNECKPRRIDLDLTPPPNQCLGQGRPDSSQGFIQVAIGLSLFFASHKLHKYAPDKDIDFGSQRKALWIIGYPDAP